MIPIPLDLVLQPSKTKKGPRLLARGAIARARPPHARAPHHILPPPALSMFVLGGKRTSQMRAPMSAYDPKQTSRLFRPLTSPFTKLFLCGFHDIGEKHGKASN